MVVAARAGGVSGATHPCAGRTPAAGRAPRDAARARAAIALAVALAALATAGTACPARAQEGPYSSYLVGERSLGLAGAFVAVADDTSAIFHNPAGTASLSTSAAAGSLWALVRGSHRIRDGYRSDLGSAELGQSSPLSLPLFLAGVVKLGPRQADGVRPHALGAAYFTPYNDERGYVAQLGGGSAADRLEVRHHDQARWLGLSYAYRVRPGVELGLSTFVALRSIEHDEVELRARQNGPQGSSVGSTLSGSTTLSAGGQHGVLRLGTLIDLAPALRAGVMLQLPGLRLGGTARAESFATRVGPDPTQITLERAEGLRVRLPMPWELRMGLAWLGPKESLISLDLSLFGPAGDPQDPLPLVASKQVQLGAFVPAESYRRAALRGALGFQTTVAKLFPIRGGLFFERSAAPAVLSMTDVYAADHIDTVGVAISFGLRTAGYDLAIGTTAVVGAGRGLALQRSADFEAPARYRATDVRETMLMVFIGGARSAVGQLARTISGAGGK